MPSIWSNIVINNNGGCNNSTETTTKFCGLIKKKITKTCKCVCYSGRFLIQHTQLFRSDNYEDCHNCKCPHSCHWGK